MTTQFTALRGPVLSCTDKNDSPKATSGMVYEPDTLIILNGDEIKEFGPAKKLNDKIPRGALVKSFKVCKIIKTVTKSL